MPNDNGWGVPKDYKLAVKWYRKSAEQGYALGQFNLGWMYRKGLGVPKDYVLSHMWFNLSAANGNKGGQKNRDIIEKRMTPFQIADAKRLARNFVPIQYIFDYLRVSGKLLL
ncbi:MAG: tetratricopeptide repeat protein [Nitrospinota bacterium]|nr:tetratricopeptide repeat protein [Nitrospinota bacterium]